MSAASIDLPVDKLKYWTENHPQREVLFQPKDGNVTAFTWQQIHDQANAVASQLKALGYVQGDKIAILSKNCAQWFIADFALMIGGYISIPIYPTANAETIEFVLQHAECKAIFIGKLDDFATQEPGIVSGVKRIDMGYPTMTVEHTWQDCISCELDAIKADITPDSVMTILYTSGSTGQPKGAIHSYRSFVNVGLHLGQRVGTTQDDRSLSYLPLAHCTERAYVESTFLSFGAQIYFVESLDTFSRDLQRCSPTVFGSVPRLWTLFQKGVLQKMPQKKLDLLLKIPFVNSAVKKKIKAGLGLGDAKVFLSGSAPISEKILEWYQKLDINIGEGWGMTETFAAGTTPKMDRPIKFGTISLPTEGVELRIAGDGEILMKTDSNMLGYYKDDAKTQETLIDGFVQTGDLGELDGEGYVKITGRKKDIFKTEKGKYVAPVPIEKLFAENEYIEQMCLMGTSLKQPVLIVNLSQHAKTQSKELITESLEATLQHVNTSLEKHETVGHIIVANSDWTPESGELTPTLKVKRHVIEKAFLSRAQQSHTYKVDFM
ncbi:AMP-binding protein [Glaciecola sp. SC05]|uniref:AMP-binding protein n=1 Tax=Glaciecola sp. SC05 TaxID=1987355 RepID=UPI003529B582